MTITEIDSLISGYQIVIGGAFALITFFATRAHYAATQSAKLHDRLFELNKLTIQFGDVAADYESMRTRQTPYFAQSPSKQDAQRYHQFRAYTYFRLNLYEEAFASTQGLLSRRTERGAAWREYIQDRMAHALARELFKQNPKQFSARFAKFVEQRSAA